MARVLDKAGHVAQQPPTWAGWTAVIALAGGRRGRRAAARAGVCYGAAAVVANLMVKPMVRRPRPRKARKQGVGPVTSSFPSGHAATHLAFIAGASRELPLTFVPLALSALAAHWSIVRSRGHHPSDVVLGGCLGLAVGLVVNRLWPRTPPPGDGGDAGRTLPPAPVAR
ncbi:MAG: phosphatase PAP2 family protein [Actinomycetota bacterium]|nr:phosphatase PAP2 family protein [Actinomycetota bacterium]